MLMEIFDNLLAYYLLYSEKCLFIFILDWIVCLPALACVVLQDFHAGFLVVTVW